MRGCEKAETDGFAIVVHYAGNSAKAESVVTEIIKTQQKRHRSASGCGEGRGRRASVRTGACSFWKGRRGRPFCPLCRCFHSGGDVEAFDKVIATNLRGSFLVLGQAAQHVSAGGRTSSPSQPASLRIFSELWSHIASKAGVEGLVRVLANELRGRNITVNAVAPGPIPTELFLKGKTQAQIENLKNASARTTGSSEISPRMLLPGRTDGGWINAQVLRANGGFA